MKTLLEISRQKLIDYMNKISADSQKHPMDPTKRDPKKANKSVKMFSKAFSKVYMGEEKLDVPTLSVEELAKLHNLPIEEIEQQLKKGIAVEMEHTTDKELASEIARDHLKEDPKYYDKLAKIHKK